MSSVAAPSCYRSFDSVFDIVGAPLGSGAFSTVHAVRLKPVRLTTPVSAVSQPQPTRAVSVINSPRGAAQSSAALKQAPFHELRGIVAAAAGSSAAGSHSDIDDEVAAAAAAHDNNDDDGTSVSANHRKLHAASDGRAAAPSPLNDSSSNGGGVYFAAKVFVPQSSGAHSVSPARLFGMDETALTPTNSRSQCHTPVTASAAVLAANSPGRSAVAAAAAAGSGGGGSHSNSPQRYMHHHHQRSASCDDGDAAALNDSFRRTSGAAAAVAPPSFGSGLLQGKVAPSVALPHAVPPQSHRRFPSSSDKLDGQMDIPGAASASSPSSPGVYDASAAAALSASPQPVAVTAAAAAPDSGTCTPVRMAAAATTSQPARTPLHGGDRCTPTRQIAPSAGSTIHNAFTQAAAEAQVLASAPPHPNLLRYVDAFLDEEVEAAPVIVTELARGRELFEILQERQQQQQRQGAAAFTEEEAKLIVAQLLSAIAALHDAAIVHRDVKVENIILDERTMQLTLVDFGLAVRLAGAGNNTQQQCAPGSAGSPSSSAFCVSSNNGGGAGAQVKLNACCGSPHYVAPEMLKAARFAAGGGGGGSNTGTPQHGPVNGGMLSPISSNNMMATMLLPPMASVPHDPQQNGAAAAFFARSGSTSAMGSPSTSRVDCGGGSGLAASPLPTPSTALGAGFPSLPSKLSGTYGREIDVWAAGVVLYLLVEGCYPFHDERRLAWYKGVVEGAYRPPTRSSAAARAFYKRVFEVDPRRRVTAAAALSDPLFADIDVAALQRGFAQQAELQRKKTLAAAAALQNQQQQQQQQQLQPDIFISASERRWA